MRRLLGVGLIALAACSPEAESEHAYVPADNYVISVEISVPGEGRVGEWIPLSAQRRTGPWKRVKRAEVPAGFVPFGKPPAEFESEVADNLHWKTEPPSARFDVPLSNPGHTRKVQFDKPGTYQIWASNAYPTDAESNVVTITIRK